MARTIFGNDYADIANRELGMDSARDSRFFNTLNANQRAQQMADEEDRAAQGNQLQWAQFLAGLAKQRRQEQEQRALEAQGLDNPHLTLMSLLQTAQQAKERNALEAEKLGLTQGNELMGLIQQGAVNPSQIDTLYPGLPANIRSRAAAVYGNLAAQEDQNAIGNRNAAETANQLLDAERMRQAGVTAKAVPGNWIPNWMGGRPAVTQEEARANLLADLQSGKKPLPPLQPEQFKSFLDSLFRNHQMMNKVQVDEQGQVFTPADVPRRYLAQPQPRPVVPSVGAAPSPFAASIPDTASRIYHSEAEARASGLGTGDVALFADPGTGRIRRGRIK